MDPDSVGASYQAQDYQDDEEEVPLSKTSCDRCRHRKVRCDRKYPCSYCIRIDGTCTYPSRPKPKERRQRILISEQYERKIDDIARKLEEFGHTLGNLNITPSQGTASSSHHNSSNATPTSSNPTPETRATAASTTNHNANKILTPKVEYEGESSLSAQAAFANRFLRDAISSKPSVDITGGMASVLDSLSLALGNQKSQHEGEYLYPHARTLQPGSSLQDLPLPPIKSAMACLRMAQEHPRVRFMWHHEANSITSFSKYFFRVYSPGDATQADLIIVHAGLYWLFLECMYVVTDEKAHYEAQAAVCRDNLETVLSSLPFHMPCTMDTTYAMSLASIYCLQTCKPMASWNFIATASHMSQTLGMHSIIAMAHDDAETKRQKMQLFWIIYTNEKGLSLRLGRSSTIRDSDITIPQISVDNRSDVALFALLPQWTELARLQGMVYDQIYSPAALIQPQAVRTARARRLAAELEAQTKLSPDERRYMEKMHHVVGDKLAQAFHYTNRVNHLSIFCLIYRAIPAEQDEGTVFGKECIASAREALEEHQKSMAVMGELEEDFLETYVNWALLQSPFVPVIVLFCHVIETCDEADLDRLGGLVGTLQSAPKDAFSTNVKKELRLFKLLYDVACSYVRLKEDAQAAGGVTEAWGSTNPPMMMPPQGVAQTTFTPLADSGGLAEAPFGDQQLGPGGLPAGPFAMPGDLDMEVDQQGAQLGNWLYMNHQMIRALEDSYF